MNSKSVEIGQWLSRMQWTYFCTFTTEYELTLNSARRAMQRFFDRIKVKAQKVRLFWVAEPFKQKSGYHLHLLIYLKHCGLKAHLNDFNLVKITWKAVSGGRGKNYAEISRYNKDLGAPYYLIKDLQADNYDFQER